MSDQIYHLTSQLFTWEDILSGHLDKKFHVHFLPYLVKQLLFEMNKIVMSQKISYFQYYNV